MLLVTWFEHGTSESANLHRFNNQYCPKAKNGPTIYLISAWAVGGSVCATVGLWPIAGKCSQLVLLYYSERTTVNCVAPNFQYLLVYS